METLTIVSNLWQGVRIDYALASPGLLERVVSCEIISTLPPKWSDHAAVLLELADIPHVPRYIRQCDTERMINNKNQELFEVCMWSDMFL